MKETIDQEKPKNLHIRFFDADLMARGQADAKLKRITWREWVERAVRNELNGKDGK